jgi:tripartite-type tricarboxylate transporter receptor subunit TctC
VSGAFAQEYPSKLVRLVISYPPGGSSEQVARILTQALTEEWKQPVIIENKPGAGTTLGAAYAAKADPDGYTLYLAAASLAITASLYKDLPYDAVKSFAPISLLAVSPFVLTVHPQVKATTVGELINLAKAKPNTLNYASSGSGAGPHLAGEMFRTGAGIDVVHVPFKGTAPAITALLGAQVEYFFSDVAIVPHVRSGRVRALAVTSATRSALLPDLPTVAESGIPDYEIVNWMTILAPAGTPRPIIQRINASIQNAIKQPAVRQRYNDQGFEPKGSTPQELEAFIASEVKKYAKVVAQSGAKVD